MKLFPESESDGECDSDVSEVRNVWSYHLVRLENDDVNIFVLWERLPFGPKKKTEFHDKYRYFDGICWTVGKSKI